MIQVNGASIVTGDLAVTTEVTANHAVPSDRGNLFKPELVEIHWTRPHLGEKWTVVRWSVYTKASRNSLCLTGRGTKGAPEFMEAVFAATRPRATVT